MTRNNPFSDCHPAVCFVFYLEVLIFAMILMDPLCLLISIAAVVLYRLMTKGKDSMGLILKLVVPVGLIATLFNAAFNHRGVTPLMELPTGNMLTLESIMYGLAAAAMLAAVIMWAAAYGDCITSEKFIYLTGRVIPALSLVLSMTMRFIPEFRRRLRLIHEAQVTRGEVAWAGAAASGLGVADGPGAMDSGTGVADGPGKTLSEAGAADGLGTAVSGSVAAGEPGAEALGSVAAGEPGAEALRSVVADGLGGAKLEAGGLSEVSAAASPGKEGPIARTLRKTRYGIALLSILITWSLEDSVETADSMRCRGYGLRGRTAYSIYKFGGNDFPVLIWILAFGALSVIGKALGYFDFEYYPALYGCALTAGSCTCYIAYALLCLTPVLVNIKEGKAVYENI